MNHVVYDGILKEYFDTTDRKSIRTLLSLNEADQNQAMVALAAKLYEKIVAKVDDIDFGTIPASKGDITKIGNFMEMRDCMDTIRNILVHYKQDTCQLDTIDKAIENIKSSKKIWEKAFVVDCEMAVVFYNTMVLSIVSAVSLLISSSIDFIKEPDNDSFRVSFDRVGYNKTKDKLLFESLEKFNKSYSKGEIEKVMKSVVDSTATVKESSLFEESAGFTLLMLLPYLKGAVFVTWLLVVIIPIMHILTNILYCAKQSVADYFELQAKVVQFNAENLKYDYTKSEAEIKKIYDKQISITDKFKKISSAFAVKMSKAETEAKKKINEEKNTKFKAEDLEAQDVPGLTSSIF